jgi:hypothetical protein
MEMQTVLLWALESLLLLLPQAQHKGENGLVNAETLQASCWKCGYQLLLFFGSCYELMWSLLLCWKKDGGWGLGFNPTTRIPCH